MGSHLQFFNFRTGVFLLLLATFASAGCVTRAKLKAEEAKTAEQMELVDLLAGRLARTENELKALKREHEAVLEERREPAPAPRKASEAKPRLDTEDRVVSEDARRSSQQHYLSGVIFFQKGDHDAARREWELSRGLDPANVDALAGLNRLRENDRRDRPAPAPKAMPKKAGDMTEADRRKLAEQHYLSGVVYFQKGDYAKAHDEWDLAVFLDPQNTDAKAGLERIEAMTKDE